MENIIGTNSVLGFLTLTLLELGLGIDNLVFISLLASKLAPNLAKKANIIGLSFALITRLLLLFTMSWIVGLTKPLFTVYGIDFAARNIILLVGGIFLLTKATIELHERIEGEIYERKVEARKTALWHVIAQIVVLDAIFSVDSIITAVGMVHDLKIMVAAIFIAIVIMLLASNTLMKFITKHPTVIILCLGFLLMIGFNLVVEAFNVEMPKGYLYAAIGFSICVEAMNQFAYRNRKKSVPTTDLRSRTAGMVLRLLGGDKSNNIGTLSNEVEVIADRAIETEVFKPTEKEMIKGVLDLAERSVRSIMSPRNEVEWLDLADSNEVLREDIRNLTHSRVIVARNVVDEFVGVVMAKDLLASLIDGTKINWQKVMHNPLVVHENTDVLSLMEKMRQMSVQIAIVVDEHGSFEGIVTPTDIFKAISGNFVHEDDKPNIVEKLEDGSWMVNAAVDIRYLSNVLEQNLVDENDRYTTLAGYILWHLGRIPVQDEEFCEHNLCFKVVGMDRNNISKVHIYSK